MDVTRKIQKLITAEALLSLWDHAKRWAHPVERERVYGPIDRAAWTQLQSRFPDRPDAPRINRFSDIDHWLRVNIERAQDLWLDRTRPLRILDLGCGPGYFLYVCRCLGHQGLGLDIDEQPLFRETTALLGVRRVISRIEPRTPLPDLGEKFDLVTGHRVCFQKTERFGTGPGEWNEWDRGDWQFFLDDVRNRILKPGGRILLDFNPRADGRSFFTPELRDLLHANGARIFRSKALLPADRTQVAFFKATV
jgi:SAM-dependent methyltransferase